MRINVKLEVSSSQVYISIPQADIVAEEPCLIAYDLTTEEREFLAVGKDEESLLGELAGKGYTSDNVGFLSFPGELFNPHLTSLILGYYAHEAIDRIRPANKVLGLFDLWRYDIRIARYEDLPEEVCMQFEHSLIQSLRDGWNSTINGQRIKKLWWKHTFLDSLLAILYIILMPGLFALGFWGFLKITGVLDLDRVPIWVIIVSAFSMFAILFASAMVNGTLLGMVWAVAKHKPFSESLWSRLLPKALARSVDRVLPTTRKSG